MLNLVVVNQFAQMAIVGLSSSPYEERRELRAQERAQKREGREERKRKERKEDEQREERRRKERIAIVSCLVSFKDGGTSQLLRVERKIGPKFTGSKPPKIVHSKRCKWVGSMRNELFFPSSPSSSPSDNWKSGSCSHV